MKPPQHPTPDAQPPSLPALRWPPFRGSLRAQLIAWNIAVLALLLGGLGLVIRGAVNSAMMASIDRDLDERLRHFREPPRPAPTPPPNQAANGAGERPGAARPIPREEPGGPQGEQEGVPFREEGDDATRPFPAAGSPQPQSRLQSGDNEPRPEPFAPAPGQGPEGPGGGQNRDPYRPLPLDLRGQALGRQENRKLWDAIAFGKAAKGETVHSTVLAGGQPLRVLSRRFPPEGAVAGVIQTAYPLSEVYRARQDLDRVLLMLIPLALACAGLGGAYLTGRVLRRVHSMTLAAEQISAQQFSQRLPVAGNDEFARLADTFNGLLTRLEGAFQQQTRLLEQQRRFTADASHELKTPLTIIKGHTSLTLSMPPGAGEQDSPYRQSLVEIDRAADSMSHLVQDLLLLARSDGGQLGRHAIKLPVREILERALSGTAGQSGVNVTFAMPEMGGGMEEASRGQNGADEEPLCVMGNEAELIRLFVNLLDNAVRYTPTGGSVCVRAERHNGQAWVTIADTGIGVAPEHLPHLGERFYRVDTSRTRPTGGTGLGLSICKGIVEAHGGTLTFASVVGKGTTVDVTLPAMKGSAQTILP